jgi:hypothetical protein
MGTGSPFILMGGGLRVNKKQSERPRGAARASADANGRDIGGREWQRRVPSPERSNRRMSRACDMNGWFAHFTDPSLRLALAGLTLPGWLEYYEA